MAEESGSDLPNVDPILEAIRRTHPGHQAKIQQYVDKLLSLLDSYLSSRKNLSDNELLQFAMILEKIQKTSYYVYNELRKRTSHPSIYDKAISMLRWSKINRKLGGKLPRMK